MLPALFLLAAMAAQDTTVPVQRGDRLRLDTHEGSITVRTWTRSDVRVSASGADDDERVRVTRSGGTVTVRTDSRWGAPSEADYDLTVPAWLGLTLETVEGDITVTGSGAPLALTTVQGDISVTGGTGNVTITAVDGDVVLRDASGNVSVTAVNGDVEIRGARGPIAAGSTNGDVLLLDVASNAVQASSVNGDVTFGGPVDAAGRYTLGTHNGDVTIGVQDGASATVSVNTFMGDFVADFPVRLTGTRPQRHFSFTLGGGGARIELESFQGTIRLARPAAITRAGRAGDD